MTFEGRFVLAPVCSSRSQLATRLSRSPAAQRPYVATSNPTATPGDAPSSTGDAINTLPVAVAASSSAHHDSAVAAPVRAQRAVGRSCSGGRRSLSTRGPPITHKSARALDGLSLVASHDSVAYPQMTSAHVGAPVHIAPITHMWIGPRSSPRIAWRSPRLAVICVLVACSLAPSCSTNRPRPVSRSCDHPTPAQTCSPGMLVRCSAYTAYNRSPQPEISAKGHRSTSTTSPFGGITELRRIRLKFATPAPTRAASKAASSVLARPMAFAKYSFMCSPMGASMKKRRNPAVTRLPIDT